MQKTGFSAIEILIVASILALLILIVTTVFNPLEQLNRTKDTQLLWEARELVQATQRANSDIEISALSPDLIAQTLDSDPATRFIKAIRQTGELKETALKTADLPKLYLTLTAKTKAIFVCFLPSSTAFKLNKSLTTFDQTGKYNQQCTDNCYSCLSNSAGVTFVSPTAPVAEISSIPINDCEPFNPAYPRFPGTCNTADRYTTEGCSNFCVSDLGCNQPQCQSNQRLLKKTYYGTGPVNFVKCSLSSVKVDETYCATVTDSHCDYKSYPTDQSDYVWGCTNPVRPYKFK